jgi:hypothetical protein
MIVSNDKGKRELAPLYTEGWHHVPHLRKKLPCSMDIIHLSRRTAILPSSSRFPKARSRPG